MGVTVSGMGWVMLLVSLPLAFLMGAAAQKGSICAVTAARELLDCERPRHLMAIAACSAWVLAITAPLAWLVPRDTLAVGLPLVWTIPAGAALFGVGAVVNNGCAFSTITRCAAGDLSKLATALGLLGGLAAVLQVPGLATAASPRGELSPLAMPQPWSAILVLVLLGLGAVKIVALARARAWRDAWSRPRWSPFAATAVIGVAGGTLYALHGAWMYTSLLPRALGRSVSPESIPMWEIVALTLAVLAGAGLSARQAGRVRLRLDPGWTARSFAGGVLMGAGGALAAGGNDVLVLHVMPALALHGLVAFATMTLSMLAALWVMRRLTR